MSQFRCGATKLCLRENDYLLFNQQQQHAIMKDASLSTTFCTLMDAASDPQTHSERASSIFSRSA
jgi:hypothetical protein